MIYRVERRCVAAPGRSWYLHLQGLCRSGCDVYVLVIAVFLSLCLCSLYGSASSVWKCSCSPYGVCVVVYVWHSNVCLVDVCSCGRPCALEPDLNFFFQ